MFDEGPLLTESEDAAYLIACLETEYGEEMPDPYAFVTDEHQRFLDCRARLLTTGAAHLDGAVAAAREVARAEARRLQAVAAFARARPAALFDRVPGEQGAASAASVAARPGALTEVSEWAVDEAAATLRLSGRAASLLLIDAVTLVEGLPATFAALCAGDISPLHARAMVELAGPVADPVKRAEVEAEVLPRAVAGQTVAGLRACARRAVTRIDAAAAAARLVEAVRDRQVRLEDREDGMSAMTSMWTTPVARACYQTLSAYAGACEYDEDGNRDPRTHQQRMTDCLADLILRPHADRPPVQVTLTLVAGVDTLTGEGPGTDEPGEVDGDLVPAALTRELAYSLGLLPRPAADADTDADADADADGDADDGSSHPDDTQDGHAPECEHPDGRVPAASNAGSQGGAGSDGGAGSQGGAGSDGGAGIEGGAGIAALRAAELAAADELWTAMAAADSATAVEADGESATRAALTRLLDTRRLLDTALAERPRIAVTDLSGTLLALTDSTELRAAAASGRGLGPPAGTDAYQPTDPLHRFVRLRDRRCRFPGCRTRARCCDLDHQVPHPHGPTAHDNLACLCEHHHRLSHQAPGWRLHRDPDGALVWTLPGGRTITTRPPAFGTDDGSTTARPPTSPPRRTGRQRYLDALASLRDGYRGPPDPNIPF
jgi:hypothetical protein